MSEESKTQTVQEDAINLFKQLNTIATTMFDVLLESDMDKILNTPTQSFNALIPVASIKLTKLNKLLDDKQLSEEVIKNYLLKLIDIYKDIKLLEKMIDETVKVDL